MATIRPRRRRDGKLAYQAEVRIKRNGRLVHRESKTFGRRQLATAWATRLEEQLSKPDAVPKRKQLALRGPLHKILLKYRHDEDRIFPFEPKTIGSAFTRACRILEIEDLHFHDLRHEATSRLFEA